MNRPSILIAAAAAVLCLPATAADKSPSQAFIEEAVQGNIWEVQVGQLARSKAGDEEVRKFGAMLNNDHGEATRKSAEAAQALGVTPPTKISAKHKALYDRLSGAGDKFDREFIKAMIDDHRKDIEKYEKQAKQPPDAAATYAKDTLPRLREHLRTAESLQSKSAATSAAR